MFHFFVAASNKTPSIILAICSLYLVLSEAGLVLAHEGHRPLPTRGMEVDIKTGKMILTRSARETLDVQTVEVVPQQLSPTVLGYGSIVSPWDRHALISSPLAGRIVSLHVTPGESVRAGQLLAEIESPELDLLQLELRTSQTELELSKKLVASTESASKKGAIAAMREVEAQIKFQQDQAALEIARAKWFGLRLSAEALQTVLSDPRQSQRLALTSPIDGVVTHADLTVGKVIDPKEHLFEVLDLSTVWLKMGVLEKDLAVLETGQPFDLTLTAYPGETVRGEVEVLGQFLDPQTHLGTVWATLSNSATGDPRLLPGMSGQVTIHVNGDGERLVVPLTAVVRDGAERFVLVEEEQTKSASVFQKQTVVLGQRMGNLIEVRGGQLFPGDRVVTQGSHELGSFFTKGVLSVNKETERDIGLQVEPVSPRSVVDTLSVDGMVDVPPTRRTVAASQMSGSIQRILVDRGEKVARGQVLAEIVSQEFQNLQLDLLRAQLEADLRETSLNNLREVGDAVPLRQLWETESQLNQANSRRDSAERRLRAAGLSSEQLKALIASKTLIAMLPIRAPIDGVVTEFDKVLGHVIRADEPVFEIHDLSQVWVQALISERDLPKIQMGQTARVRLVADPTEAISGTVVRSGRSVGPDDRTLAVWIELTEMPRISVQHNMLARVTVETGIASSLLAVPREAVVREGTRAYVFVQKEDSTFERRFVQLGRSDDTKIEIRRGLVAGEPIAVRGAAALQTGYAALR